LKPSPDLMANPGLLEVKTSPASVREARTESDRSKFMTVYKSAHQLKREPGKSANPRVDAAIGATAVSVQRLIDSDNGHCFIVEREEYGRKGPKPVAIAALAICGTVAYISKVASREERHGYARLALAQAIRAALPAILPSACFWETDPVICLATDPNGPAYPTFRKMGLDNYFTAQCFTLTA